MFIKSQTRIATFYAIFAILSYILEAFSIRRIINLEYTTLYASDSFLFKKFANSLLLTLSIIFFYNFIFGSNLESLIVSQILYIMYIISKSFQIAITCVDYLVPIGLILFMYNCSILAIYYDEFYREIKWIYHKATGTDPILQKNFIVLRFSAVIRAVSSVIYLVFFFIHLVYFKKFIWEDMVFICYVLVLPAEYVFYKLRYDAKKYGIISIILLAFVLMVTIIQEIVIINILKLNTKKTPVSLSNLQIFFLSVNLIVAISEYRYFDQMQLTKPRRFKRFRLE